MATRNRAGSAEALKGEIIVLSVFVSTVASPWTTKGKHSAWEMILQAEDWLSEQATAWGAPLSFENQEFGFDEDIVVDAIPKRRDDGAFMAAVAAKLGFDTVDELHATMLDSHDGASGALVLVVAAEEGHAFALPYDLGAPDERHFLESAVVFREDGKTALCASTVARAVLELFGALDLQDTNDPQRSMRNRGRFPGEVMIEPALRVAKNVVGPVTAYLVGWTDRHDESFASVLAPGVWERLHPK
jgi:hypothetical protein